MAIYTSAGISGAEAIGPLRAHQRASVRRRFAAPAYDLSKRALDLGLATLLLVALFPLIVLACAVIFTSTGDWPLFRQRRIGKDGAAFTMLKLRTMRAGAGSCGRKTPVDARVTAVGRLLRRTSLDEAPQLVNVIAGQMSLVGPRPNLPEEVVAYAAGWRRRLSVKPGLSGLWQVSGRSTIGVRRWMAMDRYYVRHRSLALDLIILARTFWAVVSMRGAW